MTPEDQAALTRLAARLAEVDARISIRRTPGGTRFVAADKEVAEVGHLGFRALPGGGWWPLFVTDDEHVDKIERRVLTLARAALPERAGPSSTAQGLRPQTPAPDAAATRAATRWAEALRARGVPAEIRGDVVRVPGVGTVPTPKSKAKPGPRATKFVRSQTQPVLRKLYRATTKALALLGDRCHVTMKNHTVHVTARDKGLVATVNRYRIAYPPGFTWDGDPLADASGLALLAEAMTADLAPARGERRITGSSHPTPPTPTARRPIDVVEQPPDAILVELPDDLPSAATAKAMVASARLRTERTLVPAVAVEVPTAHGTIVFATLDVAANPLEARFMFTRKKARFEGGLRLKRKEDPISLRVAAGSDMNLMPEAWVTALVVYAEMTCGRAAEEHVPVPRTAAPPDDGPRTRSNSSGSSTARRPSPRSARGWGTREPREYSSLSAAVADLRAVSGHVRRLRLGSRASPEALALARRAGIDVPAGFTWVRPHSRGDAPAVRITWLQNRTLW